MAGTAELRAGLPAALAEPLAGWEEHLRLQRDLSEHTVRGYVGDVVSLLDHLVRRRRNSVADLDLATLRSWLAQGRAKGDSRSTTARRAASARSFTAHLRRTGQVPGDVGLRLASPRAHRTLPGVLGAQQARDVLDRAGRPADVADGPEDATAMAVRLRNALVVELLYASGVRVGELVGLDVDDVDRARRLLRVLGKGRKERSVPFGAPAPRRWTRGWPRGGRGSPSRTAVRRCCSGPGEDGWTPARRGGRCTPRWPRHPALPTSARTGSGTPPPRTSWRAAPTCGRSRSCWATLASRRRRSTRT